MMLRQVVVWLWWMRVIKKRVQGCEGDVGWHVEAGLCERTGADAERKQRLTS